MPLVQPPTNPCTGAPPSSFAAAEPCVLGLHPAFQVPQQLQCHPHPFYTNSMPSAFDSNALAPCPAASQNVIHLPFASPFLPNVYITHTPWRSGYSFYPYGVEYTHQYPIFPEGIAQPPMMVPSQANLPIIKSVLSSPDVLVQYTDNSASKETSFVRRRCHNCFITEPPSWRHSPLHPNKIVCNRCGLYEKTHARARPYHPYHSLNLRKTSKSNTASKCAKVADRLQLKSHSTLVAREGDTITDMM